MKLVALCPVHGCQGALISVNFCLGYEVLGSSPCGWIWQCTLRIELESPVTVVLSRHTPGMC